MKSRDVGIEIVRIVAMFFVIVMHINTQGGVIANLEPLSLGYAVEWILLCITYCAVNCYALISGYVGIGASYRLGKIVFLWVEVLFYTVIITMLFRVVVPDSVGMMDFVKAFTPASSGQYWFFSAYFGLFFFIPFLNYAINGMDKRILLKLLVIVFAVYSLLPTVRHTDPFMTDTGYSTIWLIVMYLIGGVLRKGDILRKISRTVWCILFWVCVLVAWLSKILLENVSLHLFGEIAGGGILISYISPIVVLQAIALIGYFMNVDVTAHRIRSTILAVSQSAFPVFIIHEHPLMKHQFISGRFAEYANLKVPFMVFAVVLTAVVIFCSCAVMDQVRILLFRICHVKDFCKKIGKKLDMCLAKAVDRLV